MIDTHAHLDACEGTPGEVMARARGVGVRRVLTIGTGIEGGHTAIAIAGGISSAPGTVIRSKLASAVPSARTAPDNRRSAISS